MYIPYQWIKNKNNEAKVHELLDKLDCDLREDGENLEENILKELNNIGEDIIIEKYKNGEILFGA
ncbi:MAG: hypothetical protein ACLS28_24085 [Clostridium neonatale]